MRILVRLGPLAALALLTFPVFAGLTGTVLPAFGYLPVLGSTDFSFRHLAGLAGQAGILHSVAISFLSGVITTLVSLAVVFLFVSAHAGTAAFRWMQHFVSPLLSVPHAAAAVALAFLITPSGVIVRLISPELSGWTRPPDLLIVHDRWGMAMMAGLIVKEIPFLFLMTLAALPQLDLARSRAIAASLGYGRITGFTLTVWPSIYRQIRLAVFAVIAFSSSVVDVAAILGPTTPPSLAVRVLVWMGDPDLNGRYLASAGALLQLAVTLAALLFWMLLEGLGRVAMNRLAAKGRRLRRDRWLALAGTAMIAAATVATLVGLATLMLWSIAGLWPFPDLLPSSFTWKNWARAGPGIPGPLITTLTVALASTVLATVIVIACLARNDAYPSRSDPLGWIIYLPLVVPQLAFLFGLHHFFVLLGVGSSWLALVLAHLVFVLPYVYLSLRNPWQGFDRRYEIVARTLAKPAWQILLRIRLSMLLRAVLTAAAVGFAVSVGLFLPTVLIGGGRLETITTEAVTLAAGGNRRIIGVYAVLQLLLPLASFAVAIFVPALLFRSRRALRV